MFPARDPTARRVPLYNVLSLAAALGCAAIGAGSIPPQNPRHVSFISLFVRKLTE